MKKQALFMAAMAAEKYKVRAWVFSAFALTREDAKHWMSDPYLYRIIQTPTALFYVDDKQTLLPIEDAVPGKPLYGVSESVTVPGSFVGSNETEVTTTYGRLLFHFVVVVHGLSNKIPFMNKRIDAREVESLIIDRLQDTPAEGVVRDDKFIYVDEYLRFCDAMFYLTGFTQLCVPAMTPKSLVPATGIKEYRNKLLAENKDHLHDPAVVAMIDAKLVEYDKAYMKGDLAEGFLLGKKPYSTVRKRLYSMNGAISSTLDNKIDVELSDRSLSEGWDINHFPGMINSLRSGSYNRGAETVLGGEAVKWLLRASSNINVTVDDCGSMLGVDFQVTEKNYQKLIKFSIVIPNGKRYIPDDDTAKEYIGKTVMIRSPMYCILEKTDYCRCCVGENLALNPSALSSAVTEYGSALLYIFMQQVHSSELILAEMDYLTAIT